MSVVIAFREADRWAMASDGRVTSGNIILAESYRKVRRFGDVLVGAVGQNAICEGFFWRAEGAAERGAMGLAVALRHACEAVADKPHDTPGGARHYEAEAIAVVDGRLWCLDASGVAWEIEQGHCAIGSGREAAAGALAALNSWTPSHPLHLAERAERVVRAVYVVDTRCGGTVTVEIVDDRKEGEAVWARTDRRRGRQTTLFPTCRGG